MSHTPAPRPSVVEPRERPAADVLVIGGGINGIATFRDLALQGVDVALVERGDYVHDPDAPEGPSLGAEFWKNAKVVMPETKTPVSLRVDREVLDWFKAQGPGYQTRMNAVLRSYMEAASRGEAG